MYKLQNAKQIHSQIKFVQPFLSSSQFAYCLLYLIFYHYIHTQFYVYLACTFYNNKCDLRVFHDYIYKNCSLGEFESRQAKNEIKSKLKISHLQMYYHVIIIMCKIHKAACCILHERSIRVCQPKRQL